MDAFVVAVVLSLWVVGLFLVVSMAWFQRRGDRRLAAAVSAELSPIQRSQAETPAASTIPLAL